MSAASDSSPEKFATTAGTQRYMQRFAADTAGAPARVADGHFRRQQDCWLSSLGAGTYLGEPDARTDQAYTDAIVAAVRGGINVIDSALNYRLQHSERAVGAALARLAAEGWARDEIVVCTKAGFLTPDGAMPADPSEYFNQEFVSRGIFGVEDIAAGCHCITPAYLEDQLERSLRNLGVEGIDVFYLHNPETQLAEVSREEFRQRILAAFRFLESAADAGRIRFYGVATWNGFRQSPQTRDYLSLAEMAALAGQAGGPQHRFRFVQVPFNLAMREALIRPNQSLDGQPATALVQVARALGITLVSSAALLQGQLTHGLPDYVAGALGLKNDLQRALQFARSAPGITTALVGMSSAAHVRENLEMVAIPPAPPERFRVLFANRTTG
jgi:aryl-alcohol dehydrogenase-like predicted oxidoreductase